MAWFKRPLRFTILTAILVLVLTIGIGTNLSAQVLTQQRPSSSLSNKLPNRWNFNLPRGRGIPVNRQGGATRTAGVPCTQGNGVVTALVPASGVGATTAAYPTLFWYMPKSSASEVELVLQDANQEEIYSTRYRLAHSSDGTVLNSPGVMSLPLPSFANLTPLQIDQNYYWKLAVICDPSDRSADIFAGGAIVRIKPDSSLTQRISQATPQERVALYANAGLWYETVNTLVALRRDRTNDTDLEQAWNKLLNSVGLDTTFKRVITSR